MVWRFLNRSCWKISYISHLCQLQNPGQPWVCWRSDGLCLQVCERQQGHRHRGLLPIHGQDRWDSPQQSADRCKKYTADSSAGKGISWLFLPLGKTCLYNATNSGANLTSWIDIPHKSEAVSNHHHPDLTFICLFRICRRPLVVWVRSQWQLTQAGPPSTSTRRESTTTTDAPVQGFLSLLALGSPHLVWVACLIRFGLARLWRLGLGCLYCVVLALSTLGRPSLL